MSLRVVGTALRVCAVGLVLLASAPRHAHAQGQIAIGQSMMSQLTAGSAVNNDNRRYALWSFSGAAGQYVQIDMTSTQIDSYLILQDQNGNELSRNDDGGGSLNSRITYTLPYTGMYRILAMSYRTSGVIFGSYTLSLMGQGGMVAQPMPMQMGMAQIAIGQSMMSQLTASNPVDGSNRRYALWTFYGNAGQSIQIDMTSTELDSWVALQDQNGQQLAYNDDGGGSLNSRLSYTLPYTGMYRIQATSYRTSGVIFGNYTLSLMGQGGMVAQPMPQPMVQPMVQPMANPSGVVGSIMPGQQAQGVLTTADARWENKPFQAYQFQCAAGQTFQMDVLSTWDNYGLVFDPMGNVVARNDDDGDGLNARINYTCQVSGVYRLAVTVYSTSGTGGAYTMQVSGIGAPSVQPMVQPAPQPAMPTGVTLPQPSVTGGIVAAGQVASIAYGQMMQGRLEPGDQTMNDGTFADVWTFQGSGGLTINVDVRSDEFDTYVQLLDASGNRLAEDDDSGGNLNSRLTFTLPSTGQYQLVVNNFGDSRRTGVYTIWLH